MTEGTRSPLPPMDRTGAAALWSAYCTAHPERVAFQDDPPVEAFGDSVELADELLALVLHGPKRATAGLVAEFTAEQEPLPRIGGHWVVCDGRGVPQAVLRTVGLRLGVVESVDDAFAWDEGEGDRTRADWLRGHRGYWQRTCRARGVEFSEDEEVVFERFRVVWPPEHAD